MGKPSAILVGDLHLTDAQPICRVDDFWATQIRKGEWLRSLWEDQGHPPILQCGDVFDRWKASPRTITMLLECYPPMITIPGNHDLPAHNMQEYENSALKVVAAASKGWKVHTNTDVRPNAAFSLHPVPWGCSPTLPQGVFSLRNVMLAHLMILDGSAAFDGIPAIDFLTSHPGYALILTGHNHQPIFAATDNPNSILINPGSFTRQTASETHEPAVWLWWVEDNRVERIVVPHDPSAITREHIEQKQARDEKIAAFVESIKASDTGEVMDREIDFRRNVERLLAEAGDAATDEVRQRVWEAVGYGN